MPHQGICNDTVHEFTLTPLHPTPLVDVGQNIHMMPTTMSAGKVNTGPMYAVGAGDLA